LNEHAIAIFGHPLSFFEQPMVMAQKSGRCDLRVDEEQISRLSTISITAKPRTTIVRNIFSSVGICDRNSIIFQHDAISSVIFWLKALTSSSPA